MLDRPLSTTHRDVFLSTSQLLIVFSMGWRFHSKWVLQHRKHSFTLFIQDGLSFRWLPGPFWCSFNRQKIYKTLWIKRCLDLIIHKVLPIVSLLLHSSDNVCTALCRTMTVTKMIKDDELRCLELLVYQSVCLRLFWPGASPYEVYSLSMSLTWMVCKPRIAISLPEIFYRGIFCPIVSEVTLVW